MTAVLALVAEGGTVPFIARYRKEKTGQLDEVQIRAIIDHHEKYGEILKRKSFVLKEIDSQGNLTQALQASIEKSYDLGELDEIYRPFKRKKKTKATLAKEAGLGPLADWIWALGHGENTDSETLEVKAKAFLNPSKQIVTYEVALKGAQDILVEKIANDPELREAVRVGFFKGGKIVSRQGKKYRDDSKFEMYKEFEEAITSIQNKKASHRYLALRRGWQEGQLSVSIKGDEEQLVKSFYEFACNKENQATEFLKNCGKLAFGTHVVPSISNEVHRLLKEKADADGVFVFTENVRKILVASPFGSKCVLGVDPGLRSGCKLALVDKSGAFISNTVMKILGDSAKKTAVTLFTEVLKQIEIEAIAVGNGTGGRETEVFLRDVLKQLEKDIPVVMVNEAGASVYSASDIARAEFPDLDLTVRGAISIARRLQDPLAELVKIDPKSIGVGQYQHDVSQTLLKKELKNVVEDCVNQVGVDLNTASEALFSYVAGVGPVLAKNIVEYRKKNGLFKDRSELQSVERFSSKTFEQAAGFLRVRGGGSLLDSTGIHPERYTAVKDMAIELGIPLKQCVGSGAAQLRVLREKWSGLIGEFTFDDIVNELEKPGRDPRDAFKLFKFREDIHAVKDLQDGMICPGLVTNVTNFGAFVDIGVHQDGLVHISELTHTFVDDPRKVVNPGDQVKVKVIGIDVEKSKVSLSMKMTEDKPKSAPRSRGDRAANKTGSGKNGEKRTSQPRRNAKGKRPAGNSKQRSNHRRPERKGFNNAFAGLAGLQDQFSGNSKKDSKTQEKVQSKKN